MSSKKRKRTIKEKNTFYIEELKDLGIYIDDDKKDV